MPVVVAGITRKSNILLLKRRKEPFKGLWSLPGGKIGLNEFMTDALKREVFEETKLSLSSMKFVALISQLISDGEKITKGHLINVFSAKANRVKVKPCSEGQVKWFTPAEIEQSKEQIIPTDFYIITKVLFKKQHGAYTCLVEREDKEYFLKNICRLTRWNKTQPRGGEI